MSYEPVELPEELACSRHHNNPFLRNPDHPRCVLVADAIDAMLDERPEGYRFFKAWHVRDKVRETGEDDDLHSTTTGQIIRGFAMTDADPRFVIEPWCAGNRANTWLARRPDVEVDL